MYYKRRTFKVKGQSLRSQHNVTYQQLKRYKPGTDRLTEFSENYPRAERNM